jgi:hypothetical protein
MGSPLDQVCCASLPWDALAALAGVRCLPGVLVRRAGDRAWVRWDPGADEVLRCVLPVAGVELYAFRDGLWYRHGHHLPSFDVPTGGEVQPLHRVLTPAPVQPEVVGRAGMTRRAPVLVRDDRPRAATALRCGRDVLARWADVAPSGELATVRGAWRGRQVMLLGEKLPALAGAERFWGERLLAPLGYRVEPALPERVLLEALGLTGEEILVVSAAGADVLPRDVFRPLTRAGVRLALRDMGDG